MLQKGGSILGDGALLGRYIEMEEETASTPMSIETIVNAQKTARYQLIQERSVRLEMSLKETIGYECFQAIIAPVYKSLCVTDAIEWLVIEYKVTHQLTGDFVVGAEIHDSSIIDGSNIIDCYVQWHPNPRYYFYDAEEFQELLYIMSQTTQPQTSRISLTGNYGKKIKPVAR